MKKILTKCFSIVAMLLCIATIASCVAVTSNTSIQINKFPEETYVKDSDVNEALENITITVYENSAQKASGNLNELKELGVNVEGFNLAQIGTYTAKISYGTATVAFTYTVVQGVLPVDSEDDFNVTGDIVALELVADVQLTKQVNIPENSKVVLDLGAFTLTTADTFNKDDYLLYIPATSSLEVKGEGSIVNNKVDSMGTFNVYGELVIREGNFTDYSQTFVEKARLGALLNLNENAQLTIYNGDFKAIKAEGYTGHFGKEVLDLKQDSFTKIYGGKFYNESQDGNGDLAYGAYAINSVGNLFIYGGQFDGGRGAIALVGGQFDVRGGEFGKLSCKYRPIYCSGSESAVSGVISGGIFYANASGYAPIFVANPNKFDGGKMEYSSLVISGGTFINAKGEGIYYGGEEYGSLLVQGGLFQTKNANIITCAGGSAAIVPGYEVVTKTVDGKTYYSVEKK